MRNAWELFKGDLKRLRGNVVTVICVLGIIALPSIFSWYNMIASWNVFENTGNLSVAVANVDEGYKSDLVPIKVSVGDQVVSAIRANDQINWVITTEEDAIDGARSGKYYAAVVIGEDFSYNMYHMLTEWTGKPTITYYENYKKNAVATKITDTAVSSLKTTISKSYLDVVVDAVFRGANDLSDQLKGDDPVGSVQGLLGQARSLLRSCAQTVDAFQAAVLKDRLR